MLQQFQRLELALEQELDILGIQEQQKMVLGLSKKELGQHKKELGLHKKA